MNIYRAKDHAAASRKAADMIVACVKRNPQCVLGLATGKTPLEFYDCLVSDYTEHLVSFSEVITFNLDEYRGLSPDDEQSYHFYMRRNFFNRVDINPTHTHIPNGVCDDADKVCTDYERAIADVGGIDIQVLGLGQNGHIGFNEPDEVFPVKTHCVKLAQSTIQANSRFFGSLENVPREAYTVGIATIMAAKKIVMIATGADKAGMVSQAFFGSVRPQIPASILQFHQDVTVILDEAAAAEIPADAIG